MAKVQETAIELAQSATPRTIAISITGVTAGNALVAWVLQTESGARTYTASSNVDGALESVAANNSSLRAAIFEKRVATAGSHTITITANTGSTPFYAQVLEVSDLDSAEPAVGATATDASDATTHYAAPSGDIDSTRGGFWLSIGVLNSASGVVSTTADTGNGWAKVAATVPGVRYMAQYRVATESSADDRGQWTHSGTARTATCAMAWFPAAVPAEPDHYDYTRVRTVSLNRGIN